LGAENSHLRVKKNTFFFPWCEIANITPQQ